MILNAQLATQSQSCTARFCPADADPGSDLCTLHIRLVQAGVPVVLHHVEQPAAPGPETHLWCACHAGGGVWLPDEAFNKSSGQHGRRGRRCSCRECDTTRRQAARQDPETKRREAEAARLYRLCHAETPEQRQARLLRRRTRARERYHEKKALT